MQNAFPDSRGGGGAGAMLGDEVCGGWGDVGRRGVPVLTSLDKMLPLEMMSGCWSA